MSKSPQNVGRFQDQVVLITGGGKGIGREIARIFGAAGARVAITGRDVDALNRQADEFCSLGYDVLAIPADVTDREACRAAVEQTVARFGRLDVLVNNAGMSMRGSFRETSLETFQTMMDINFTGAVSMTHYALDHLLAAQGSVVFVSSLVGLKGLPGVAPYSAAKMALTAFSESLRCELWSSGVHVGIVYVSFTENDPGKTMYDARGNRVPLVRDRNSSTQEDVARAVVRTTARRRRATVLTPLGKTAALFYTLFPALSERLIARFAARSGMYGSTPGAEAAGSDASGADANGGTS